MYANYTCECCPFLARAQTIIADQTSYSEIPGDSFTGSAPRMVSGSFVDRLATLCFDMKHPQRSTLEELHQSQPDTRIFPDSLRSVLK